MSQEESVIDHVQGLEVRATAERAGAISSGVRALTKLSSIASEGAA